MPFDLARCDIADRTTIAGKGRPVVLVHGVGGPGVWRYVADLLAPRFRVIVPTFPGFLPGDGALRVDRFLRDRGLRPVRSAERPVPHERFDRARSRVSRAGTARG